MKNVILSWKKMSLIKRIIIGIITGILLALFFPQLKAISLLGKLFVGALKAIAPLLVLTLVVQAISHHKKGRETNMKLILVLYLMGTFSVALVAVLASYVKPLTLKLQDTGGDGIAPPGGLSEIFQNLLLNLVDNPINALVNANYLGILFWAMVFGLALQASSPEIKKVIKAASDATSQAVVWVINCAPFGIMGLVFATIAENGLGVLSDYAILILVLVTSMLTVALVVNPLIGLLVMHKNPYPLVLTCLRESGMTAFFTRSSAANIPVNMQLCEKLGLDKDTYSVSIPLGATINMAGATITINILTLVAANTFDVKVSFLSTILLSIIASLSACGASGVAGGSLLLIPVACSLFGIPNDLAMQVVGVGFIIGVVQDSCETALNSSTDVYLTAVAENAFWKKK
ncbi:serine/threonine transporter SstT [Streptococcus iniae]|nr:serine/threonine transporter SstT [Streptococcus iniae]WNZ95661.1 serine/threonine transporter SstT [Streptococcus iniae]